MGYKWNPEDYKLSSANQESWGKGLLLKAGLKGRERVLDIGCGDGRLAALISQKVSEGFVLGIDSSREMIESARNSFPKDLYPNLEFIVMSAEEIDFEEEFDLAFSNACLHWVKDHPPVLKRVWQSLKPSGRILFQMGGKGNAEEVVKVLNTVMGKDEWMEYFTDFSFPYGFYGPEEYELWLSNAGFKVLRAELIPKDMLHHSREEFTSWIRATWLPYTQRVPENLREKFINEVVEGYLEKYPPDEGGIIHVRMVRLEVEAEKV